MFTLKSPAKIIWEVADNSNNFVNCNSIDVNNITDFEKQKRSSILKKIIEWTPLQVVLIIGEQISINEEMIEILHNLYSNGIYVQLCPNTGLISNTVADNIAKMCDIVSFTFAGGNKVSHDLKMGDGSFENTINCIKLLKNNKIEIFFLLTKKNYCELKEIIKLCSTFDNIAYFTIQEYIDTNKETDTDLTLDRPQMEELMLELARLKQQYKDKINIRISEESAEIKALLEDRQFNYQVYIAENGEVYVNKLVRFSGGNILSSSLEDIWNNNLSVYWQNPQTKNLFKNFKNVNNMGINNNFMSKGENSL